MPFAVCVVSFILLGFELFICWCRVRIVSFNPFPQFGFVLCYIPRPILPGVFYFSPQCLNVGQGGNYAGLLVHFAGLVAGEVVPLGRILPRRLIYES